MAGESPDLPALSLRGGTGQSMREIEMRQEGQGRSGRASDAAAADAMLSKLSADQWIIDVLADLQEAARDRELYTSSEKLAQVSRVVQDEITRKRIDRMRSAFQTSYEQGKMPSLRKH